MRRAERGLTLLEVLGAVALLGILYTVLAGSAIDGLRSEGESRRRLAASLLADRQLAEIELSLASGAAPELGSQSAQEDGFTVLTEVRAFEPPPPREDPESRGGEPRSLAARHAAADRKEAPSLFEKPASPTTPPALRSIEVVVRWEEGTDVREIRRTTYALDAEAIGEVFASIADIQAEQSAAKAQEKAAKKAKEKGKKSQEPLPEFKIPSLPSGDSP
jgi:type II secretory pathway pseudopilin PulG